MIEFDSGGRAWKGRGLGGRLDLHGRVDELEDALGRRHGGLHDVVLFAQILNRAEKSHAILEEGYQHTDLNRASADTESAVGQQRS